MAVSALNNTNTLKQTQTHVHTHTQRYTASGAEMSFAQSMHGKQSILFLICIKDTGNSKSTDPVTLKLVNENKLVTEVLC